LKSFLISEAEMESEPKPRGSGSMPGEQTITKSQVEADGDLHIALQDATGDKPGIVVA